MFPRFNLKWLLAVVALACISMAIVTQVGMGKAEFEILENELHLNERGLIQGVLRWGYVGTEYFEGEAWPFVCQINNVENVELLKLKPGQKDEIIYRVDALGPLRKQDPFAMYIVGVLGIDSDSIVGYVEIKDRTEVVIDGSR